MITFLAVILFSFSSAHGAECEISAVDVNDPNLVEVRTKGLVRASSTQSVRINHELVAFSRKSGEYEGETSFRLDDPDSKKEIEIESTTLDSKTEIEKIDVRGILEDFSKIQAIKKLAWFDYERPTQWSISTQFTSLTYNQSFLDNLTGTDIGVRLLNRRVGLLGKSRIGINAEIGSGKLNDQSAYLRWRVGVEGGYPIYTIPNEFRVEALIGPSVSTLSCSQSAGYSSLVFLDLGFAIQYRTPFSFLASLSTVYRPILNPKTVGSSIREELVLSELFQKKVIRHLYLSIALDQTNFTVSDLDVVHNQTSFGIGYRF